jgi:hypothetical protein
MVDESIDYINKIFQISPLAPKGGTPKIIYNDQI